MNVQHKSLDPVHTMWFMPETKELSVMTRTNERVFKVQTLRESMVVTFGSLRENSKLTNWVKVKTKDPKNKYVFVKKDELDDVGISLKGLVAENGAEKIPFCLYQSMTYEKFMNHLTNVLQKALKENKSQRDGGFLRQDNVNGVDEIVNHYIKTREVNVPKYLPELDCLGSVYKKLNSKMPDPLRISLHESLNKVLKGIDCLSNPTLQTTKKVMDQLETLENKDHKGFILAAVKLMRNVYTYSWSYQNQDKSQREQISIMFKGVIPFPIPEKKTTEEYLRTIEDLNAKLTFLVSMSLNEFLLQEQQFSLLMV